MAALLQGIVIDCNAPAVVAQFWGSALGYEVESNDTFTWLEVPPGVPGIGFQRVPEAKGAKNRLHLDLVPQRGSQAAEVSRLIKLGATRTSVGEPADASWVVLADPEGNEFCVLAGG